MSNRGTLYVLSGPSGVGKDTLVAQCLKECPSLRLSVSATTRAPRPGEMEGQHYFFVSTEQFEGKIQNGGMLEWAKYNNCYYGTPRAYVEQTLDQGLDVMLVIEVQGAMQVRTACGDAVLIFVLPPDFASLRHRLFGRGTEDPETVEKRLYTARMELARASEYDFVLVNAQLESAVQSLREILEGGRHLSRLHHQLISEVCGDAETYFVAN